MLKKNLAASVVFAACVSFAGMAQAELVFYVPVGGNAAVDVAGVMAPDSAAGGVINAFFSNDTPAALGAGQSLDFASPDQVVDFGNLPLLEGKEASTVSMWINPFGELVPDGNRRHYTLSKDGVLEYGFRNAHITNRVNNADHAESEDLGLVDGWNHIASVFDASGDGGNGTTQHYVNGVPFGGPILLNGNPDAGANEGGLIYVANDNSLTLGNRTEGGDKDFNGLIDDIAIWDDALTAPMIAQLFAGTSPPDVIIPEPSTLSLVVLGLIGILGVARRRRRRTT